MVANVIPSAPEAYLVSFFGAGLIKVITGPNFKTPA